MQNMIVGTIISTDFMQGDLKVKYVPLKVRQDCDGNSRYVIAILFIDDKGRARQDLSRDDVLNILASSFKLLDEQAKMMLDKADAGFAKLEHDLIAPTQSVSEVDESTEFDLG